MISDNWSSIIHNIFHFPSPEHGYMTLTSLISHYDPTNSIATTTQKQSCICSTLRSWLHSRIKFCPLDWRSNIHWNVVQAIFQHNHICQDCWKIRDQHLNVWLFQNPGDKIQKRWRTMRQICPVLSTRIWTLSPELENNQTLKSWSGIFPTILRYMIMLENCQNNISVYDCFPIQGTKFYSWNLMKPGFQSGTYKSKQPGCKEALSGS